jgi:hypothetical protein
MTKGSSVSSPLPPGKPLRFNPPPNWPAPPSGWTPPPGWSPGPSLPPKPEGWQLWVQDPDASSLVAVANARVGHRKPRRSPKRAIIAAAVAVGVATACAVTLAIAGNVGNGGSSASADKGKLIPTCAYEVTIDTPAQNEQGDPSNLTIDGTGYVIVSAREPFSCPSVGSVIASGQWWDTQNDSYDSSFGTNITGAYGATVARVANPATVYESEPNGLECHGPIGNYVVSVYDYGSIDVNSEAVAICNDWNISGS